MADDKTDASPATVTSDPDTATKSGNKNRNGAIAGLVIAILVVLAVFVYKGNVIELGELTSYQGSAYTVQYPLDWTSTETDGNVEFHNAETSEDSVAGLAVFSVGVVPRYGSLTTAQKDEIINQQVESLRTDASVIEDFSEVTTQNAEETTHPAGDRAISFELGGTLKDGGEGAIIGFVIVTDEGQTYIIFTGGDKKTYDDNSATFTDMLNSFSIN